MRGAVQWNACSGEVCTVIVDPVVVPVPPPQDERDDGVDGLYAEDDAEEGGDGGEEEVVVPLPLPLRRARVTRPPGGDEVDSRRVVGQVDGQIERQGGVEDEGDDDHREAVTHIRQHPVLDDQRQQVEEHEQTTAEDVELA
jgi:hypothetical protein